MKHALTFLLLLALLTPLSTDDAGAQSPTQDEPDILFPEQYEALAALPLPDESVPAADSPDSHPAETDNGQDLDNAPSRFASPETSLLGITPTTRCHQSSVSQGDIVTLKVAPFADLRLQMPVPVQTVKLGGGPFWEATFAQGSPHIWIKSASLEPEAAETSLSVLDTDLRAWDFVLRRSDSPGYTCAMVELSADAVFERELLRTSDNGHTSELNALRDEIASLREDFAGDLLATQQAASNRINEMHSRIYAGYAWSAEDADDEYSARLAQSILSVHDDGVRTFIRVADMPSIGLIAIHGQFAGESQLVQTAYDPLLGMYTITGIYDRLRLSGAAEDAAAIVRRIKP